MSNDRPPSVSGGGPSFYGQDLPEDLEVMPASSGPSGSTGPGTIGPGSNVTQSGGGSAFAGAGQVPIPQPVYLANSKYGALLNGSNDDAALAAAAADVPRGGQLVLPPALIGFSAWAPRPDINVQGAGYWCSLNQYFGNPGWSAANYGANFGGTVLVSSATAGTAFTVADPANDAAGGSLRGVMILGPGTGTSTGLQLGGPHFLVCYDIDVFVANFYNGVSLRGVEDSTLGLRIRGIANLGYDDTFAALLTSNNRIRGEVQCVSAAGIGWRNSINSQGNHIDTLLVQNVLGQPFVLAGNQNQYSNLWSENASAGTAPSISGTGNVITNHNFDATDQPNVSGNSNLIFSANINYKPVVTGYGNILFGYFDTSTVPNGGNILFNGSLGNLGSGFNLFTMRPYGLLLGQGGLAQAATTGFVNVASMAGAPTGSAVVGASGYTPLVYDTTNHKLWFFDGGSWKGVVVS